ncbi:hypothetical protein GUJ93_ZPchr0005g15822 [Zizania palustris]|uniref:Uncharacterized protein n=1 Tax=Zizania palustris TaxID=103762 RepID=A0A8J5W212_ZIZPA|nr:hypothetical protein GUJ93_ZPchr0005g15822 [Zizania palustris]
MDETGGPISKLAAYESKVEGIVKRDLVEMLLVVRPFVGMELGIIHAGAEGEAASPLADVATAAGTGGAHVDILLVVKIVRPILPGSSHTTASPTPWRQQSDELLCKFADPDTVQSKQLAPPHHSLVLCRKQSSQVASGLFARDSGSTASGVDLVAPKQRRSISWCTKWKARLLPTTTTASAREGGARHSHRGGASRLDGAARIGFPLTTLEWVR